MRAAMFPNWIRSPDGFLAEFVGSGFGRFGTTQQQIFTESRTSNDFYRNAHALAYLIFQYSALERFYRFGDIPEDGDDPVVFYVRDSITQELHAIETDPGQLDVRFEFKISNLKKLVQRIADQLLGTQSPIPPRGLKFGPPNGAHRYYLIELIGWLRYSMSRTIFGKVFWYQPEGPGLAGCIRGCHAAYMDDAGNRYSGVELGGGFNRGSIFPTEYRDRDYTSGTPYNPTGNPPGPVEFFMRGGGQPPNMLPGGDWNIEHFPNMPYTSGTLPNANHYPPDYHTIFELAGALSLHPMVSMRLEQRDTLNPANKDVCAVGHSFWTSGLYGSRGSGLGWPKLPKGRLWTRELVTKVRAPWPNEPIGDGSGDSTIEFLCSIENGSLGFNGVSPFSVHRWYRMGWENDIQGRPIVPGSDGDVGEVNGTDWTRWLALQSGAVPSRIELIVSAQTFIDIELFRGNTTITLSPKACLYLQVGNVNEFCSDEDVMRGMLNATTANIGSGSVVLDLLQNNEIDITATLAGRTRKTFAKSHAKTHVLFDTLGFVDLLKNAAACWPLTVIITGVPSAPPIIPNGRIAYIVRIAATLKVLHNTNPQTVTP